MDQSEFRCPHCDMPLVREAAYCIHCHYQFPDTQQKPARESIRHLARPRKKLATFWWVFGATVLLTLGAGLVYFLVIQPAMHSASLEGRIARDGGIEIGFKIYNREKPLAPETLEEGLRIARMRLDSIGEPYLLEVRNGNYLVISVALDSPTDPIIEALTTTGLIEFIDTGDTYFDAGDRVLSDLDGPPYFNPGPKDTIYHSVFTIQDIQEVSIESIEAGQYAIQISFTPAARELFTEYTTQHVGDALTIAYDRICLISPRISTPITEGKASIEGEFTEEEAERISNAFNSGMLPFELRLIDYRKLKPTFP